MKHLLEVCTGSLQSVEAAVKGGAERIELCSALSLDGLTPSYGMVKTIHKRYPLLKIHALIRSREGDFVYSDTDLQAMLADIRMLSPLVDGIVGGALQKDGSIDEEATAQMVEAAGDKPFTFHRAFDVCKNPIDSLETLIRLGCARVLTSGQASTAEAGIPLLKTLVEKADGRIIILAGGGVNLTNAARILAATGTTEIHGSCKVKGMLTDEEEVARVIRSISK